MLITSKEEKNQSTYISIILLTFKFADMRRSQPFLYLNPEKTVFALDNINVQLYKISVVIKE